MKNAPLYQMNPQDRFSDRAEDYAKYRPSYPSQAIDCILEGLGKFSQLTVADIGAGTGIASQLIGSRGVKVLAIEPNQDMREAATSHPFVKFREGNAEQTTLPDDSVDLITCFQSFHWFNPESTLKEFARILKSPGRIALIWNDRDIKGEDEFTCRHGKIIAQFSNQNPILNRFSGENYAELYTFFPQLEKHVFNFQQTLTQNQLIGLALSASYLPKAGDNFQALISALKELHNQYCDPQGLVNLKYKTTVFIAQEINLFLS